MDRAESDEVLWVTAFPKEFNHPPALLGQGRVKIVARGLGVCGRSRSRIEASRPDGPRG